MRPGLTSLRGLVGAAPGTRTLSRETGLGPCNADVHCEAVELGSGTVRFRVTEEWTPPAGSTVRQRWRRGDGGERVLDRPAPVRIQWTRLYDHERQARTVAGEAAKRWREGSARSDELAPGGRLRGL